MEYYAYLNLFIFARLDLFSFKAFKSIYVARTAGYLKAGAVGPLGKATLVWISSSYSFVCVDYSHLEFESILDTSNVDYDWKLDRSKSFYSF